ncbi:MAG: twin-arginine translocation signal domain-containing protein [Actinomycetota bacterium]|nr:twin-arginine translocation signal domain-containing protein [Actinomycetota bacterium]
MSGTDTTGGTLPDHEPEPAGRPGIDRRAALKKAAAAGAVAWTAPIVLSSTASAQVVCTLRCAPTVAATVTGTATSRPCNPLLPPGQQPILFDITINRGGGATCPCGGNPTFMVNPSVVAAIQNQPGNSTSTFTVIITVTCLDRDGDRVSRECTATGTFEYSGNCQSAQVRGVTFSNVTCGAPRCNV